MNAQSLPAVAGQLDRVVRRVRRKEKPRLRPASVALLAEIASYVARHDCRGRRLFEAASDVLDGVVGRKEVDELVRRRLLATIRIPTREIPWEMRGSDMCGIHWTVEFTERAMQLFWPDRRTPNV